MLVLPTTCGHDAPARRSPMILPEVRDVRLDAPFVHAVRDLVGRLEPHFSWREFTKIPRARVSGTPSRQLRDLVGIELLGHHGHLATSTAHELSRALSVWRSGLPAQRLFELLCLNLAVDERDLAFALSPQDVERFVAARVLFRRGATVMMPVSLLPYGDRWYIGESWHLKDNAELYGTQGAPVGYDTSLQIEYLKQRLGRRRLARMLEIGPGTGIVLLEMGGYAERREGAEYDARTLAFAEANLRLHGDDGASVFASDLLSGASGRYDLVVFNPWQPSEEHFGLIARFLEQARDHLAEQGAISLLLNTRREGPREPLMESLSAKLAELGLTAERDIVHTFSVRTADGSPALRAQHFSWITQARGRSRAGANITDRRSLSWLMLEGRSRLGGLA